MVEDALRLEGKPVSDLHEVEQVRNIRNACRSYMTRHTNSVGPDEQMSWWASLDKALNVLMIFHVNGAELEHSIGWSDVAGYGLCRLIGDKWWVSGGLDPKWQGKGLGKQLFQILVDRTGTPCWLEVLEHNMRAFNTYARLGFVEVSRESGIITMVKPS